MIKIQNKKLQKLQQRIYPVVEFGDAQKRAPTKVGASPNFTTGFTLIEVTVTVMLFTILMVVGTGAVLNANTVHQRTQKLRTAVDNLSFIMDDMARTMRTGSTFRCAQNADLYISSQTPIVPEDCPNGIPKIVFDDQEGERVIYRIVSSSTPENPNRYGIEKFKEGNFLSLTVPEIDIDETNSGFVVTGADPDELDPGEFNLQPRVTIRLSGTVAYKDVSSSFNLQTTVSQRLLDIPTQ